MSIKQGRNIIAGVAESDSAHFIGEWVLIATSNNVIPKGCIRPDGFEQLDAPNSMFADLWNYCLRPSPDWDNKTYLDTCTYAEYEDSINKYGACPKWGVDYAKSSFKVPFIPDGYYIKQGKGTANKAGLPNVTGKLVGGSPSSGEYTPPFKYKEGYGAYYGGPLGLGARVDFDLSTASPIYGKSNTVETDAVGLRLFIYIANGSIGDFDVNWNKIQSALTTKLNSSLDNMLPNNDIVTEYKVNPDNSWYRRYKSGWLEQGGYFNGGADGWQGVKCTYVKPFKDTKYQLICLGNWSSAQSSSCRITAKRTTGADVTVANNTAGVQNNIWYALGEGV